MAKKRFVAVVGCRNYFEPKLLKPSLILKLVKEPENLFDEEASGLNLRRSERSDMWPTAFIPCPGVVPAPEEYMIHLKIHVVGLSGLWWERR